MRPRSPPSPRNMPDASRSSPSRGRSVGGPAVTGGSWPWVPPTPRGLCSRSRGSRTTMLGSTQLPTLTGRHNHHSNLQRTRVVFVGVASARRRPAHARPGLRPSGPGLRDLGIRIYNPGDMFASSRKSSHALMAGSHARLGWAESWSSWRHRELEVAAHDHPQRTTVTTIVH